MKKYWMIFKTEVASMAAFRAEALIWLLFDIFLFGVYPFVLINILGDKGTLQTLSTPSIVTYYAAIAFFSNFIWTHPETHVALEIKEGLLSNILVKPQNYLGSTLLHEIAWKGMRFVLFIPLGIFFVLVAWKFLVLPPIAHVPLALLTWPGALIIFYLTAFLAGATAFWLEENSAVLSVFWISSSLFGGFYLPLNLFPQWLAKLTEFLPWRYAIYEPIQAMFQNYTTADVVNVFGKQALWILILYGLYRIVWYLGIRKYTAVGR